MGVLAWFVATRIGREVGVAILAVVIIGVAWRWSNNRAFTKGKGVGGEQMSESIRKEKAKEWQAKEEEFAKREQALTLAAKELGEREAASNKQLIALRSGLRKDVAGIKEDLNKIPVFVSNVPASDLIPQIKAINAKLGPPQLQ